MGEILGGLSIIAAILGIGFVIFIHELGHFLAAKWAGVRVDRFSIGMGPVVWSRRWGDTEYALSLLPVGGYVKMLGQEDMPTGEGTEHDVADPRSFVSKSIGWRAVILSAGVLFNLVSSYLILLALAFYGKPVYPPVVGPIAPQIISVDGEPVTSPAERLGVATGDRVLAVNNQPVRSFMDIHAEVVARGGEPIRLTVERRGEQLELDGPDGTGVEPVYHRGMGVPTLGFDRISSSVVGTIAAYGVERPEALQPGARLLEVNGEPVADRPGHEIRRALSAHVGDTVTLTISHQGKTAEVTVPYAGLAARLGAFGFPVLIGGVVPESAAAQAGLQTDDVIVAADGEELVLAGALSRAVERAYRAERPVQLTIHRGADTRSVELQARFSERHGRPLIGINYAFGFSGPLPVLPGTDNPLVGAGVTPGTRVVDWQVVPDSRSLALVMVEGGELQHHAFDAESWAVLDRRPSISRMAKVFGAEAPPPTWELLAGSEILDNSADDVLQLRRHGLAGSEPRVVSWSRVPKPMRPVLQALEPGSFILSERGGTEQRVLRVLQGSAGMASPRVVQVSPRAVGIALTFVPEKVPYELDSWSEAFTVANDATKQMVTLTLRLIPRLFASPESGGVDPTKSLAGPIAIFGGLKTSLQQDGFATFLNFLALIGLNLFIINLLPIPIVDGGQLLFLLAEAVLRRPLPERVMDVANRIGLTLIIALMLFVIGNDILNSLV